MKRDCRGTTPHDGCGEAVDQCCEDAEGRFWVTNEEYASQVKFCPYCGEKAPVAPSGSGRA